MRLLVVEDDRLIGPAVQAVLAREGFEVVGVATTMAKALRLASRSHPDLALVDLRLGDGDGLDIAARLKEAAGVPSILMTGFHLSFEEMAKVAIGLLRKPFTPDALVQTVVAAKMILEDGNPEYLPREFVLAPSLRMRWQGTAQKAEPPSLRSSPSPNG